MRYSYCGNEITDGDRTYLGVDNNPYYGGGYSHNDRSESDDFDYNGDYVSDHVKSDTKEDWKEIKVLVTIVILVALVTVIGTFIYYSGKKTEPDYIFPKSATVLLTEKDLTGKSAWELTIARNEIAARHGYTFKRKELQEYFNGKSWYYAVGQFDLSTKLSSTEMKNMIFINQYQKVHHLQY